MINPKTGRYVTAPKRVRELEFELGERTREADITLKELGETRADLARAADCAAVCADTMILYEEAGPRMENVIATQRVEIEHALKMRDMEKENLARAREAIDGIDDPYTRLRAWVMANIGTGAEYEHVWSLLKNADAAIDAARRAVAT